VKAAATPDLIRCAVGAAANARDLLADAELLSAGGRQARAYALAAMAVEETGKAANMAALATMPVGVRAQAPVGRMLEWHQHKLVGGMLMGLVPFRPGATAGRLAEMPPDQVAEMMGNARALAQDQDELKQRALYADIDREGCVRLPGEVTEADVAAQLARARQAVAAASTLLDPGAPAKLSDPPAEAVVLGRALVSAFAEAGYDRTAQTAADVALNTIRVVQQQADATPDAGGRSSRD